MNILSAMKKKKQKVKVKKKLMSVKSLLKLDSKLTEHEMWFLQINCTINALH